MSDLEDECDEGENLKKILERDWKKLENEKFTDGFREGLEKENDAQLQSGFESGFMKTVEARRSLAVLSGRLCFLIHNSVSETLTEKYTKLLDEVNQLKTSTQTDNEEDSKKLISKLDILLAS